MIQKKITHCFEERKFRQIVANQWEKNNCKNLHESLVVLLLLLVIFLSYQAPSSAYTLSNNYFTNCGSNNIIIFSSRTFVNDLNPGSVLFTKQSSSVTDHKQSSETPSLYQTKRIFRQQSSYDFEINTNGTYLVCLHFFNSIDVSATIFDVSASDFLLSFILQVLDFRMRVFLC